MAHKDEKQLPLAELRKEAMRELVDRGDRPGLLAYRDGVPVGWVAVAPRPAYPVLERSRLYGPIDGDEDVFAITCFYVDPAFRGEGVASALLDAAIEFARRQGAKAVDAFPKVELADHAVRSARAEESFSFMGRPSSFARRDFEVLRAAGARAVVRRGFGLSPRTPTRP
jgi:GNAT superfamily N-acetyltransferase